MVEYWADRGVTSFKAFMGIARAELKAAIEAAHKRGIKVTGHLCSVTSRKRRSLASMTWSTVFCEHATGS